MAQELSESQLQVVGLRREMASIEEKQQQADSALNRAKLQESSRQQEVEVLKRNNEWLDGELKTKSNEHANFRRDKNAKISELERVIEDASSNVNSLKRMETTLRNRIEEADRKSEDFIARITRLQEDARRAEEGFRSELDSTRRLAQLQEQSAQNAKQRVEQLDDELERTKQNAADEIGQLQSELETEHEARQTAEQKVEDLAVQIERLESVGATARLESPSAPGTPRQRPMEATGPFGTPLRGVSPAVGTPGSQYRSVRGSTYHDLNKSRAALDEEKRRNLKQSTTIKQLMSDLEKMRPELEELRENNARLEHDFSQATMTLNEAKEEREAWRKESRRFEGQFMTLEREAELLRQQTRDLSTQIKILMVEVHALSEGVNFSTVEYEALHKAAAGLDDERIFEGMTDTGRFIGEKLVAFRNVSELQEQNNKLLHLTRTLGEQMEGEEAKAKQNQQEKDHKELEQLRDYLEEVKDKFQTLKIQSESLLKERDIYRRTIAHRGQMLLSTDAELTFSETFNGTTTPVRSRPNKHNQSSPNGLDQGLESPLLKELQTQFDAYKRESSSDHETLRVQIKTLAKDKESVQGELVRAYGQVSTAQERYELLLSNYNTLRSECEDLQKRCQTNAEAANKQDARAQQVTEDLNQARELSEGLRSENAHLKAEHDLWKRTENRLNEDISALSEERARLNSTISNDRKITSEREASDLEQRRKLQAQTELLETELRNVRQKLDDEIESGKSVTLRRDYEHNQNRTRIDDLMKSLGSAKEELTAAKTQRDQLQARADELKIELRSAQDHVQALRPPHTSRSDPAVSSHDNHDESASDRVEELSIELADVRSDLEFTKRQLERAEEASETYRGISQASEEALARVEEEYEQGRQDAEKISREKDQRIEGLEKRRDEIDNELSDAKNLVTELQTREHSLEVDLGRKDKEFEAELARVKDERERHRETADLRQEDLKLQADIAQRAQQNYESELVKHSDAAKNLQELRKQFNDVKLELVSTKTKAETAQAQLQDGEERWSELKEKLESNFSELDRRREDMVKQNQLLHDQLQSNSSRIAELEQRRLSTLEATHEQTSSEPDIQRLQEVINYLRREKDIVDLQYELSIQESQRLKQQASHFESEVNDLRVRLSEEQQFQQRNQTANKLAETINELNLYRESSVTLRHNAERVQASLNERSKKVEELQAQIEPLRSSVFEHENRSKMTEGEIRLLQEDRDRWQKRSQDMLHKYHRVDPEEMKQSQEKLEALQQQYNEAEAEKQILRTRVDGFAQEVEKAKEDTAQETKKTTLASVQEQFKKRSKDQSDRIKALQAERQTSQEDLEKLQIDFDALQKDLDATRNELENVRGDLETAQKAREEVEADLAQASAPSSTNYSNQGIQTEQSGITNDNDLPDDGLEDREDGEVQDDDLTRKLQSAESRAEQLSIQVNELENTIQTLGDTIQERDRELEDLQSTVQQRASQIQELQSTIQQLNKQVQELQASQDNVTQESSEGLSSSQQELNDLGQKVQSYEFQIQDLRSQLEAQKIDLESARSNENPEPPSSSAELTEARNEIDQLKKNMDDAEKELESLRQSQNDNATKMYASSEVQPEPGQGLSIRAELEQEYQEKAKQNEERCLQRVEKMKASLNEKLKNSREVAKEALQKEHDAEVAQIREEHELNLTKLKADHEQEIDKIRKAQAKHIEDLEAKLSQDSGTVPGNLVDGNGASLPSSDKEIKDFVSQNPTVRGIIARNIEQKVKSEKSEFQKQITELEQRIEKAKTEATTLAEKKSQMKLNMLEKRKNDTQAKVDFFQRAAETTPSKAVVEVWEEAKVAKPQAMQTVQVQTPAAAVVSTARSIPQETLSTEAAPVAATALVQVSNFPSSSSLPFPPLPSLYQHRNSSQLSSTRNHGEPFSPVTWPQQPSSRFPSLAQMISPSPPFTPDPLAYSLAHLPHEYIPFEDVYAFQNGRLQASDMRLGSFSVSHDPYLHTEQFAYPFPSQTQQPPSASPPDSAIQPSAPDLPNPPPVANAAGKSIPRPLSSTGGPGMQNTIRGGAARRSSNAGPAHAQAQPDGHAGAARGSGLPRGNSIRGRGGGRGMNPNAGNFQPGGGAGTKRAHEDGGGRGDQKRARGAGRGGAGQG